MPESENVIMLFYDLPSVSKTDHRKYRKFVESITKEGYYRIQESIYAKVIRNRGSIPQELKRLKEHSNGFGDVSALPMSINTFHKLTAISGTPFNVHMFLDPIVYI